MRPIVTFTVASVFPEQLNRLNELCSNLYWTWNPTIREFLRSIDPELWHSTNHRPLVMLQQIEPHQLEWLAGDTDFLNRYQAALAELDAYLAADTWSNRQGDGNHGTIAYFSAEFGLHESVPLYSGGLGLLSGDHTKSASDLGLPFVGVGLMYQMGYFQQRLTLDGTQLESYEFNDPSVLPLVEVVDSSGKPLRIAVEFPEAMVFAGVWKLTVGRVPLYLLDTNIRENQNTRYRDSADYLYGGDLETRIMQEILLGIGGMRALRAMGIEPTVTHSNEGHSAFLMLERTRMLMEQMKLGFAEASELAAAGAVFTTHTPVPAGHDVFPVGMVDQYFGRYWPQLGLGRDEFLSLGRVNPTDPNEAFSMTVLALKLTSKHNGVSQLHGSVSRDMWHKLWPGFATEESPIVGITNGVHTLTWAADRMTELFDEHLGSDWRQQIADDPTWAGAERIPDKELWEIKNHLRSELIDYVRRRLVERQAEMYTRSEAGRDIATILDPSALTIGFARRFATYKRATLLFRDRDRAYRLFTDPERPVQMVFAGKAHPKDAPGKSFVKEVTTFIRESGLESRIVFLEDYDISVARHMVQGCDIWLNTPRRPLEASGTSGMKAAINGTLNTSILDGWFPEGYDGQNGFAIGNGQNFADTEHQDEFESRQLYRVLEEQVIPRFYHRDSHGTPHEWTKMQKHGLVTLCSHFSSDRMVREYAERFYFPSHDRFSKLSADNGKLVRELINWKRRVIERWPAVSVISVNADSPGHVHVGQEMPILATISLGGLSPDEVNVEAYYGGLDPDGGIIDGEPVMLHYSGGDGGAAVFAGSVVPTKARRTGVTVRIVPWHANLNDRMEMNMVKWPAGH